MMSIWNKS